MNAKRTYFLMVGLAFLFLAAILVGTYQINGMLDKQSQKLVAAKAKVASLNQEQIELSQAKKDIVAYNSLYQISRTIVPESKNQAETVRQIIKLAGENGVNIGSITFPPSTLGSGVRSTTGIAPSASSTTTTTPTSEGINSSLSQLTKVPSIPGVYALELSVASATGANQGSTYKQLINFLSSLEQNRLTALVSQITITPAKSSGGNASTSSFTFQLNLDIYIKPQG